MASWRWGEPMGCSDMSEHFASGSVDVFSTSNSFSHFTDISGAIKEIERILKPDGMLLLGLYSQRARRLIHQARALIAELDIEVNGNNIRAFRDAVIDHQLGGDLNQLDGFRDFYTTSSCRDLLFHVEEHCYTPRQIQEMLASEDVEFLGFVDLPPGVQAAYRKMFPADPQFLALENWEVLETQFPDVFRGMFRFWVRQRRAQYSADEVRAA